MLSTVGRAFRGMGASLSEFRYRHKPLEQEIIRVMKPGAVLEVCENLLYSLLLLTCAVSDVGGRSLHPRSSDGLH
jgi:hypothetical protein